MIAPSLTLDALKAMCSTESIRPQLLAPFAVTIDAARWTVGTDGMRLLAVRHDYGAADGDEGVSANIGSFYADAIAPAARPLDVRLLREFFAAHVPPPPGTCAECNGHPDEECDECEGDGEIECECIDCCDIHTKPCTACNGRGSFTCQRCKDRDAPVRVRVGVAAYNARIAAPLLALLPDGEARFRQLAADRMTTFAGDDWFACLMPLRNDEGRNLPSLDLPVEQAA